MRLATALLAMIFAVPVGTTLLALAANLSAGELGLARRLCGGALLPALVRSCLDSALSLFLTTLAYPLGWLRPRPRAPYGATPVILVHGLYHNPSAWLLLRRRLAAAGLRDTLAFGYSSFGPGFLEIAAGLARTIAEEARKSPTGRVLLAGHSLGGLLLRAACADRQVCEKVAGMVTLGSPHRGSTLAGLLAVGRLGRGLRPGGEALRVLEGLGECAVPALSLYTPTDGMVQPLSGSLMTERMRAAGWREACVGPVSHVGLLYHGRTARLAAEFLMKCQAQA